MNFSRISKTKFSRLLFSYTLLLPIFFSISNQQNANAYSVGSSVCSQIVDTTTAVTVTTSGSNCVLTFGYSGAMTTWTVPSGGLTSISFTIKGSKGGGVVPDAGYGAVFSGVIQSLTSGSQVFITVGGAGTTTTGGFGGSSGGAVSITGTSSNNGGQGGGGSTDLRIGSNNSASRILVAGGGGGTTGVSATANNGSNANGSSGGAGGSLTSCIGGAGSNASAGGNGGTSIACRNAGSGGGGFAGGGGGGNSSGGNNAYGGHGGNGSSYWDSTYISINSDCGNGCTFWNNGTSSTNYDYSKYTNNANGSLVLTFAPITTSSFNSLNLVGTPTFRQSSTIIASVTVSSYVTFKSNGKAISGCVKMATSGSGSNFTVSCTWKPSIRGNASLTATAYPVDSNISGCNSSTIISAVQNRSGQRLF